MRLRNIDRIRQASAMTGALADRSTRIPNGSRLVRCCQCNAGGTTT